MVTRVSVSKWVRDMGKQDSKGLWESILDIHFIWLNWISVYSILHHSSLKNFKNHLLFLDIFLIGNDIMLCPRLKHPLFREIELKTLATVSKCAKLRWPETTHCSPGGIFLVVAALRLLRPVFLFHSVCLKFSCMVLILRCI